MADVALTMFWSHGEQVIKYLQTLDPSLRELVRSFSETIFHTTNNLEMKDRIGCTVEASKRDCLLEQVVNCIDFASLGGSNRKMWIDEFNKRISNLVDKSNLVDVVRFHDVSTKD